MQKIVLRGLMVILLLGFGLSSSAVYSEDVGENSTKGTREEAASPEKKEITIRNMTTESVYYTIKPAHSRRPPEKRVLKPGGIDHFPGESTMDIDYQVRGELMMNRLDSGHSYSFRYNENDELELFLGSHGRADAVDLAPFITTPIVVVDKMLQLGRVNEDDVVYDLGCGDGRIVILAAKKYGARGVGIDIDPERIKESRANAREEGVDDRIEFRLQDVMKADISSATVITLYLIPESNKLLRPLLERQLKPGTYVVSHNYEIPGWEAKEVHFVTIMDEERKDHSIFVYLR